MHFSFSVSNLISEYLQTLLINYHCNDIIWLCHHDDIGRLGFMSTTQLLHGTDHIIEVPDINIGNPHNDYGRGFYCTRVDEMAKEWACKKNTDGFVNVYDFYDHLCP